jgi:BirA family biotin operon repressor/biotin-[acetyl-CoA-carboxylase] ligase
MRFNILRFDSLDSTNTEALKQARLGADEGTCIIARQQLAGRGRLGRNWESPKDAGLYLSVVLRPSFEHAHFPLITLAAAVAVYDTLADSGLRPDIKWPNDILVDEKKICGILAETTETTKGLAVIVGIGINLRSQDDPHLQSAASLESQGVSVASEHLEKCLLAQFSRHYSQLTADAKWVITEWQQRSSYYSGKRVRVTLANEIFAGVTDGLEPNGALRIRKDDGSVTSVQAGDVEHLRSAGNID